MSELRLNTDGHIIKFGADNDVSLTHVADAGLLLNSTMKLQFNDASQFVQGSSATVLSIGATNEIDLTATAIDINGTADVSGAFTTGSTIVSTGKITADAGVDIDNFNIDGTTIALSSGDLTLDVAGDIILDAGGDQVFFYDTGTEIGRISMNSSNITLQATVSDKAMIFNGKDGGAAITALTLDMADGGKATFTGGITMSGATPTLTIGDAGAEDAKIVFDGNAQDYHIGLDDTDDSLKIGLGSALGTTAHIVMDATGAVTKPLQPAFILKKDSAQSNVGSSEFDITWETEIVDRNADFSTPSFTAPVTGIYQMDVQIEGVQLDSASSATAQLRLLASNRSFYTVFRNDLQLSADASVDLKLSVMVDMDANDTVKVTMLFANGHTTSDISYSYTHWSGYLVA
jgi:hypothetical protein